ncbi:MAG: cupin domain-containing protein [Nocardioidaceae bacterium]|jgi:quercetin dioxygenase-like cupin family protein|nr:cupin domain-containing protein [Nocardioidaceae bacterium]
MTADGPSNVEAQARELLARAQGAPSGRAAHMLRGGPGSHLTQTVIALRAGASLAEHQNPGEATVLVLDGQVRLVAGDQTWPGGRGDLIDVPASRHSLEADADSVVMLTAVKRV